MKINTITFKEGKTYGSFVPNDIKLIGYTKNLAIQAKNEREQARANALPIHEESVERVKELCYLSEHKGWEEIGWSVTNKDYTIEEVEMEVKEEKQFFQKYPNGNHKGIAELTKVLVLAESVEAKEESQEELWDDAIIDSIVNDDVDPALKTDRDNRIIPFLKSRFHITRNPN